MSKKIVLFLIALCILICMPLKAEAATVTKTGESSFTIWSVGYFPETTAAGNHKYTVNVRVPNFISDDIKNKKDFKITSITKEPQWTYFNAKAGSTTSTNSYADFASLKVEGSNIITCGRLKEGTDGYQSYENCNGNDHCNRMCFKALKNIALKDDENYSVNGKSSVAGIYYGEWVGCDEATDGNDCKTNRLFFGKTITVNGKKVNHIGSRSQALTSVQARAFSEYKYSLKKNKYSAKVKLNKYEGDIATFDVTINLNDNCANKISECLNRATQHAYELDKADSSLFTFTKKMADNNSTVTFKQSSRSEGGIPQYVYFPPVKFKFTVGYEYKEEVPEEKCECKEIDKHNTCTNETGFECIACSENYQDKDPYATIGDASLYRIKNSKDILSYEVTKNVDNSYAKPELTVKYEMKYLIKPSDIEAFSRMHPAEKIAWWDDLKEQIYDKIVKKKIESIEIDDEWIKDGDDEITFNMNAITTDGRIVEYSFTRNYTYNSRIYYNMASIKTAIGNGEDNFIGYCLDKDKEGYVYLNKTWDFTTGKMNECSVKPVKLPEFEYRTISLENPFTNTGVNGEGRNPGNNWGQSVEESGKIISYTEKYITEKDIDYDNPRYVITLTPDTIKKIRSNYSKDYNISEITEDYCKDSDKKYESIMIKDYVTDGTIIVNKE